MRLSIDRRGRRRVAARRARGRDSTTPMSTPAPSDGATAVAPRAAPASASEVVVHPLVLLSVVDHFRRCDEVRRRRRRARRRRRRRRRRRGTRDRARATRDDAGRRGTRETRAIADRFLRASFD
jgi:hypothetical protein